MAKTPYKPTIEEVKGLHRSSTTYWEPAHSLFKQDETYYESNFAAALNLPNELNWKPTVLPTGRDMVDACVDNTAIQNMRVTVGDMGTTRSANVSEQMLRYLCLGVAYRNETENQSSFLQVGSKHFWNHGLGIIKTVYDANRSSSKPEWDLTAESEVEYKDRLDDWQLEKDVKIPIVLLPVHPCTFMADPFEGGGRFNFETREELLFNVKTKYPKWSNPLQKKIGDSGDTTVEHVSFWTPYWRGEFYDWEPVGPGKSGLWHHKYGFIPYTVIQSGLGNMDSKNDPAKRYVGILRYVQDLLISESRNYSLQDYVLANGAMPFFTVEGDVNAPMGNTDARINTSFGEVNELPPGRKLVAHSRAILPESLRQHVAIAADYVAAHAAPNSIRGLGEEGVRSAVDRRQITAQAATRYAYAVTAFKNGMAKVFQNCAKVYTRVVPDDITVWANTGREGAFRQKIEKDKLKEPYIVYVDFSPVNELDEMRRHEDFLRMKEAGVVTNDWIWDQMSNVNPLAMALQERKTWIRSLPSYAKTFDMYAGARMMEAVTVRARAEAAENPPPADLTGAGAPAANAVVPSPAATGAPPPSPTQMPREQAMSAMPGSQEAMDNERRRMMGPNPNAGMQGQGGGGNRS